VKCWTILAGLRRPSPEPSIAVGRTFDADSSAGSDSVCVLGAVIIVVGLAVFAVYADPAAGVSNAPGSDWAASIVVIGAICAALLLFANRGSLTMRAATLGTVAGVLYGLSATLMKPVVENLHTEGLVDVLGGWESWVWAAAGIIGFLVQQLSLSTGRLVPSVATVSVANPVVSVMLGALVLQERFDKTPPWHAVLGVGGLALALFGAVVISSAEEAEKETGNEKEAEQASSQPSGRPQDQPDSPQDHRAAPEEGT
jgi:hypothetical protein